MKELQYQIYFFIYVVNMCDDLRQNLFLEVKKPEIKETKGTFITQKLKSSYWGPFSGLKTQDLIKRSRILTGVIFCPRSFGDQSLIKLVKWV